MTTEAYRWMMTEPGAPMVRETFDALSPGAGEVSVEIAGCGVCHTDLGYFYDGVRTNHALPLALGHEISGRVVAAGRGAKSWVGKAVIIPAVIPCGVCDQCRRGRGTICPNQKMPGNDIQGGFASHIVVTASGLCPVDETRLRGAGLGLADVSIVADAITTPYQAVVQAGVEPGALAVVIGAGGVGGYTVQIANAFGAKVVAVDIDQDKLDNLTGHGPALTLNVQEFPGRSLRDRIREFAREQGLATTEWFIFECSGTAAGQLSAFGLLNHGATMAVVGFIMDKVEVRLSNLMAFHARLLGNWGCLPEHYPAALDLVLDKKVDVLPFVEHRPLGEINHVFDDVHAGRLKRRAVLLPGG